MSVASLASLLALLPLALGPLPAPQTTLATRLCGGGSVEIPIKRKSPPDPPCHAKACHAGSCRKRFDLAQ